MLTLKYRSSLQLKIHTIDVKAFIVEARGFGSLNEPVRRTECFIQFFMVISEDELSELGGMETNAVQDALTDTPLNFCKKMRDFRTRSFFFNYCILKVHNVSEYVVEVGCFDVHIHN